MHLKIAMIDIANEPNLEEIWQKSSSRQNCRVFES